LLSINHCDIKENNHHKINVMKCLIKIYQIININHYPKINRPIHYLVKKEALVIKDKPRQNKNHQNKNHQNRMCDLNKQGNSQEINHRFLIEIQSQNLICLILKNKIKIHINKLVSKKEQK